jgi:two-component system chemotaxis response regulator CheB
MSRVVAKRRAIKAPEIIVIGTSMGGLHALQLILSALPDNFCVPIVVVQHRHKQSGDALAIVLKRKANKLCIVDAEDRQKIAQGCVYLAPADYHLYVERGEFSLSTDAAESYSRPSIDVLFESAADAYGEGVLAVLLTGANADGARGLKAIKKRGGYVVVQDPATAEAPAMPSAGIAAVEVDQILPLQEIGQFLADRCRTGVSQ